MSGLYKTGAIQQMKTCANYWRTVSSQTDNATILSFCKLRSGERFALPLFEHCLRDDQCTVLGSFFNQLISQPYATYVSIIASTRSHTQSMDYYIGPCPIRSSICQNRKRLKLLLTAFRTRVDPVCCLICDGRRSTTRLLAHLICGVF